MTRMATRTARTARTTPAIELDAAKVHAWRIERQLLGRSKATSPEEAAQALVGVQAQVTSLAALSIALRSKAPRDADLPTEAVTKALRERRLVRAWAMRGTFHLLAPEDLPTVAAAIGGKDAWRRPAWLRWFGLAEPEMDALIDAICDVLDDGTPRTRAELAEEIGTRLGAKQGRILLGSWGSALKIASDRHFLVQASGDEAGTRFARASRWLGWWREETEEEALAKLVPRYLGAYGPATPREVLRWWGATTAATMKPVFAALRDSLTDVEVEGVRALVRNEDLDAIRATRSRRGTVRLLGGFDPMIVGAGLREQLLPPAHLKRVSRTAGWISPVVLLDGRAAGVWDSRRTGRGLAITVEPFEAASPELRRSIAEAAEAVGAALDLEVSVEFGRVFAAKGPKLVIESPNA